MANLNLLKRTSARPKTRVGRGGKRGKTSGKGTKGQNSRAGHKKRPEMRDIIKKLPKRRGYGKNRSHTVDGTRPDAVAVSVARLDTHFESGAEITAAALKSVGLVKGRGAKLPSVKIVSGGDVSKKFSIVGVAVSSGARAAIEKAGGTITPLEVARAK